MNVYTVWTSLSSILLETTDDLSFIVASDKNFDIDRCWKRYVAAMITPINEVFIYRHVTMRKLLS